MQFKLGDWVLADDWCRGRIVEINGDLISVEFETDCGGGTCTFEVDDVKLADNRSSRTPKWIQKLKDIFKK